MKLTLSSALLRFSAILTVALATSFHAVGRAVPAAASKIDMEKIKSETTNPDSKYYYRALLKKFMANDTAMTRDDYRYFYYGTMFTEDYNPYRANPYDKEVRALENVYLKREHLTGAERRQIESVALKCLQDNPLELRQLMYRVYVFEANRKFNLAKIWKSKLDNLLLTIAQSGSGDSPENARIIVYPRHEFDFFNLSGLSVTQQDFVEPYYEKVTISNNNPKNPKTGEYYFNLRYLLDQYYAKHPGEAEEGTVE